MHPKEVKLLLAKLIASDFHGPEAAEEAINQWKREVAEKELPADIPVVEMIVHSDGKSIHVHAASLFREVGLCSSNSEARRLISQGGAYICEEKRRIEKYDELILIEDGMILWAGKKKVCRLRLVVNP